ncbi:uncharacterized protein TNCT_468501 [Trichonephila clavata]|uniref:Uncharacterized protein n=1 Tax=Trichonephila clavata TaxID=2740835 RepID=A0A8X6GA81_TRICU|nr:uncharacterized protein TNCT_468501 [Trichonephila clavata]
MKFWTRFKKILKNSVITGVPQIIATRSNFRKKLKLLVFIGCVIGFFWQTFGFLKVYWTYPTVVDVQYYFPDDFDLPALSVCSSNGIKSKLFCQRFSELCYPNSSLVEFCRLNPFYCDPNNNNPGNVSYPTVGSRQLPPLARTEYQEMGVQREDLVTNCFIYESPRVIDCTHDYEIVNVFDTKGLPNNCYAYNSLWGQIRGAKPIKTKTLIVFELKSERTQTNQFYTGTPFALQIAIHSPYSLVNPFMNGFSLKPCSNYHVFPSKQINNLLPPPYTSQCYNYTASWLRRSGRGPRDKRLCSEECYLNKSMEIKGCVDPFFIAYPNMEKICTDDVQPYVYEKCRDYCRPACLREDITADVQEQSPLTMNTVKTF